MPSQLPLVSFSFQGDSIFGRLPSVVYIRVAPSGMSTFTFMEPVNSLLPTLTTGASSRSVANLALALLSPGVISLVQPQSSPPSVVRAQAVWLMASGYSWLMTSAPLLSLR